MTTLELKRKYRLVLEEKMTFMKTINGKYNEKEIKKLKEIKERQFLLEEKLKNSEPIKLTRADEINAYIY